VAPAVLSIAALFLSLAMRLLRARLGGGFGGVALLLHAGPPNAGVLVCPQHCDCIAVSHAPAGVEGVDRLSLHRSVDARDV